MSTSTISALLTTATGTAWDYISSVLTVMLPFAVGIIVLGGAIYFVLRHLRIIR